MEKPLDRINVEVNGVQHIIFNTSPKTSLNEWLRSQPGLKGKEHIAILGVRVSGLIVRFCFLLFLTGPNTFDVSAVIVIHQTSVNFSKMGRRSRGCKRKHFFTKLGNLNAKISRLE